MITNCRKDDVNKKNVGNMITNYFFRHLPDKLITKFHVILLDLGENIPHLHSKTPPPPPLPYIYSPAPSFSPLEYTIIHPGARYLYKN